MADKLINFPDNRGGYEVPVKAKDNGDTTFSLSVALEGLEIEEGALPVYLKEIRTIAINEEFHQETAIESNFALPVTSQDRSFTVDDGSIFTVGDKIAIENGITETNYPDIIAINGNIITINRPVDFNYTTDDMIRKIINNMAVDGSVTPQEFRITSEQSLAMTHITRIIFEMTHGTAGDLGKFGNLPALTNGVVVRAFKGQFNAWKTITIWKTNADIKRDMYDVQFDNRSGGGGDFGTTGRATFTEFGMVGEYDPAYNDFLEILIQDDLTGLESFKMNAQGHPDN